MHAPCTLRLALSESTRRDSLTDMNPSTTLAGSLSNIARHRPPCAAAARRSDSSAAATEKAATAHHRGRPRCSDKHTSTLGTLERCQQPRSAGPADLLLVLDDPSAGAEGTVLWGVIRTHTRSRNTCNVKSMLSGPLRAGPRPRRMLLLSSGSSCARLPEPFRTLEGCIIACVASCARTCAVAVSAWPL